MELRLAWRDGLINRKEADLTSNAYWYRIYGSSLVAGTPPKQKQNKTQGWQRYSMAFLIPSAVIRF